MTHPAATLAPVPAGQHTEPDDDPQPARWTPDEQLVAAVLASPRHYRMADLAPPDRAWLVAGLRVAGLTSRDTADKLGCCIRLVKTVRADPITAVCLWAHRRIADAANTLRAEQVAHHACRLELRRARDEATRLRAQIDQLVAALADGKPVEMCRQGKHPLVGYNVYLHVDRSGAAPRRRKLCRECNRERVSRFRAKVRAAAEQGGNAEALPIHPGVVASTP